MRLEAKGLMSDHHSQEALLGWTLIFLNVSTSGTGELVYILFYCMLVG